MSIPTLAAGVISPAPPASAVVSKQQAATKASTGTKRCWCSAGTDRQQPRRAWSRISERQRTAVTDDNQPISVLVAAGDATRSIKYQRGTAANKPASEHCFWRWRADQQHGNAAADQHRSSAAALRSMLPRRSIFSHSAEWRLLSVVRKLSAMPILANMPIIQRVHRSTDESSQNRNR